MSRLSTIEPRNRQTHERRHARIDVGPRDVALGTQFGFESGVRRIEVTIDLLLQTPAGFVVIDHKSFPGSAVLWAAKALEYAPQLLPYGMTIEMSGGLVIGQSIHFTVGGGMVEVASA